MQILHIIGSKTLGGAERWFMRLTSALFEQGLGTERLVRRQSELTWLKHNLPCFTLPLRTVWDPLSRLEVSGLISRRRPDIVQTYMGRATRLTHLSKKKGPLHIARLGGYYKLKGYTHAHIWLGNTKGICDYLIQSGLPSKNIYHITNFVEQPKLIPDSELAIIRINLGLNRDDLVLLTPGRFVSVKGHSYLLQAMAQLPAKLDKRRIKLVLLGNGPLENKLYSLAKELGIEKRIVWPGWHKNPGPFYQLADLIVFPSLESETLGNVILEAWSYAKPVVCTTFRGALEITSHKEDAWQVPCQDSEKLAHGIKIVLNDSLLQNSLGLNGLEQIKQKFSKTKIVKEHINLYEYLLR